MSQRVSTLLFVIAAFALTSARALAADPPPEPSPSPIPLPHAAAAVTHQHTTIAGSSVAYTATAGFTDLVDKDGKPDAAMFSVAYEREGVPHATRPIAFVWNGGPGSSTVWLHMGSFAPMRVATNGTDAIVPPGHLVRNDDTLLDATDLVFVDAPGTGYSRIGGKAKKTDFYGLDQDARAFTSFIKTWLTDHDRWGSPKFLIGESYGTTRAANVVDRLQEDGVGVNGVVLISSALDFTALDPAPPGDDLSIVGFLPSEAAVAAYHDLLPGGRPPDMTAFLNDVRAYARGPYATALLQGDDIDAATRADVVAHLHRYLGLDEGYITRASLRIDPTRFEKELQRKSGLVTGRLDARFNGYDLDHNADSPTYDPTTDASIQDAFIGAFNRYIREDLKFKNIDAYRPYANFGDLGPWNFMRDATDVGLPNAFLPNVLPDLAQALTRNPSLRVFSANGLYDLATPFFGTEISLHHLDLNPALRGHVTFGYYPSGHMIYLENASRKKLHDDIAHFVRGAIEH